MKVKNTKKRKIIISVVIVLAVLFSAGALAYNKANDVVAETLITKVAASSFDNSATGTAAENVYNSMSDTDQAKVKEIAASHVSVSSVQAVTEYLSNNDTEGLKAYAYENLSSNEITELKALYDKYK
jgi:hypothetical protein